MLVSHEQSNQDSNDFYSVSNFAPLIKRQTTKKSIPVVYNNQQKIQEVNYQVIQELTVITPLELHPRAISSHVQTYYYQRKTMSIMDHDSKKEEREKMDFIQALTSLFRKSFTKEQNKFTILLPNATGIIYFFTQDQSQFPRLIVATQKEDFGAHLLKDGIKIHKMKAQEYERERILIEGQYIRLFFGFFLNWAVMKSLSLQVFANYLFDYSFREPPMILQFEENRKEYQYLRPVEEGQLGIKKRKLFMIKYSSMWYKEDVLKVEEELKRAEEQMQRCQNLQNVQHQYQFKFCKYSVQLDQEAVRKVEEIQK